MSILASKVPTPRACMSVAASATELYATCVRRRRRKSLVLAPSGLDRSTMTRHLPGVFLGMTARLLVITLSQSAGSRGPTMKPDWT